MSTEATNVEPKIIGKGIADQKMSPAGDPAPLKERPVMNTAIELLRARKYKELWRQCCGFIDLSLPDFMSIQRRLLLEQIDLLEQSELGRAVMHGASPRTVEEFRAQVPLTTYKDYAPSLLKQRAEALPVKPMMWGHTSGRTGEYDFKWCPITGGQWAEIEKLTIAAFCFCSCQKRDQVNIRLHDKILYGAAPSPYVTGLLARYAFSRLFDFVPPLDEAETLSFQERYKRAFSLALTGGLDFYTALPSVIVNTAERFGQRSGNKNIAGLIKQPKMLPRILKGVIRSKLAGRPMLPKDVWSIKGIVSGGSDASVYRDKIEDMWGKKPLDMYACTEGLVIALQTWDFEGLTFYPYLNFFEFIPEEESMKARIDPNYKPTTLLLNEVVPGHNYQLVITTFHGAPFVRYVVGDMIRITELRNERLNIDIPQMIYHSRVDDMIDIAGFTRLTETVIWKALEKSEIAYEDWAMRKELKDKPILHLYLELKKGTRLTAEQVRNMVHEQLASLDKPYFELNSCVGLKPLEVTLIHEGAFMRYMAKQQAAGVELGRMKVCHLNPSDETIDFLVADPIRVVESIR
jgi:hypothetical protein